jgi:hypothetical protein
MRLIAVVISVCCLGGCVGSDSPYIYPAPLYPGLEGKIGFYRSTYKEIKWSSSDAVTLVSVGDGYLLSEEKSDKSKAPTGRKLWFEDFGGGFFLVMTSESNKYYYQIIYKDGVGQTIYEWPLAIHSNSSDAFSVKDEESINLTKECAIEFDKTAFFKLNVESADFGDLDILKFHAKWRLDGYIRSCIKYIREHRVNPAFRYTKGN